jgi:hypothetical protein
MSQSCSADSGLLEMREFCNLSIIPHGVLFTCENLEKVTTSEF